MTNWVFSRAASNLETGDVVILRRRRWWQFWRPKIEALTAVRLGRPVVDVSAIYVDGERVL
jgi:hypothetical protein